MSETIPRARVSAPAGWPATYIAIWLGQQLSMIGSAIAQFALVWWVTDTTGSAAVLATASLTALVPTTLIGPFVGAVVDRYDRRTIMIVADTLVALLSLWLAYLFWAETLQIWHVYLIMFARGVFGTFHWPAMSASTPMLVPEEHLVRVAGLNQTMDGARRFIAPPLGALILSLLPLHWIMGLDVLTAALAVGTLVCVAIPSPARKPSTLRGPALLWHDTLDGLRFVRRWKGMFVLLMQALVVNFCEAPMYALLPLLVRNVFGGGAQALGLTQMAFGLGMVAGGLLLSTWGGFRRRIITSMLGMIGMSLSALAAGVTPGNLFWMLVVSWSLGGVAQPLANGPIMAIFQAMVPREMQGRVMTLMGTVSGAMAPLGLAIAGPVADALGLRAWYIAGGVAIAAVIVVGLSIPEFMRIEEIAPPSLTGNE